MLNISNTVATALLLLLLQSGARSPVQSAERHILLTNDTREPIVELFVSDDRAGNWQQDLLGPDFLLPGKSVSVVADDRNGNCRVDVKTVFDNGSHLVNRGVDACRDGQAVSIR
jgi:hypothetical protein